MAKKLTFEYVGLDDITPYEYNARHHEAEDINGIKESIKQFGMDDPIGVWSDETHHNVIVEGHGRLIAMKELRSEFPDNEEYKKVPVIHLDGLSEEQRRGYALAHNKTAELSTWDPDILGKELERIKGIDMTKFGFTVDEMQDEGGEGLDDKYTTKVNIPQYEITGDCPTISEMLDTEKADGLIEEIKQSGVTDEEKEFLIQAARRHNVFNYRNIAEYYAHAGAEMQRLMEKSALVIIDVDDAIANGYATLNANILDMMEDSDEG